jgi:hypothetical protein
MANFGVRHSDSVKLRRIDFINEHDKFRDSIVIREKKTSKQRIMFINEAVKMALLMHLWNGNFSPIDYLIMSNGSHKGYEMETYIDENGKEKAVRRNGKYVYRLDENGNKIPKPLSRCQSEKIMKDVIIENLGVALSNDHRCKNDSNAVMKICTHSIRKMYGVGVYETFLKRLGADEAYARTAALEFLQLDYGHSSPMMTTFYMKDFENIKRDINMNLNFGKSVLQKYFIEERERGERFLKG